jgi:hypothetical protein
MLQTKVAEKIKIHILCAIMLFQKSCHLGDNAIMSEPDRSQMI